MNTPQIPAGAVVLRVIAILGMGLSFSAAVLLIVAAEWLLTGIAVAAFVPFFSDDGVDHPVGRDGGLV